MKRFKDNYSIKRYQRQVIGDLIFDISSFGIHDFVISTPAQNGRNKDNIHYKFSINPPIPLKQLLSKDFVTKITYEPTKHCGVSFKWTANHPVTEIVGRKFIVAPSHALELTEELRSEELAEGTCGVVALFFSIENAQMRGDVDHPVYKLAINFGIDFLPEAFGTRYKGLGFFPPDYPTNLQIDSSKIPQSLPIKFKPYSTINSSSLYTLLGFAKPQDIREDFSGVPKNWGGWSGVNIRFGRQKELDATIAYLREFKELSFEEIGYVTYSQKWGAAPDGIVISPSGPKGPKGGERGVIEIKSSRFGCNFKAYHFAQLLWQMMALDVSWGHLLRYKEQPKYDNELKMSVMSKEFRVAPLERNKEIEDMVVKYVTVAKQAKDKKDAESYIRLIESEPFVKIRNHFETLADEANAAAKTFSVPLTYGEQIDEYESSFFYSEEHSFIEQIDQRHARIIANVNDKTLIAEQIQDLAQMLK